MAHHRVFSGHFLNETPRRGDMNGDSQVATFLCGFLVVPQRRHSDAARFITR